MLPDPAGLVAWTADPGDRPALVCVAAAGAGAAPFRAWAPVFADVAAVYAIRLPGHESRLAEPPPRTVPAMAAEIADTIQELDVPAVALFGQCSGALPAFEAARMLRERGDERVMLLCVAAQAAPRDHAATSADQLMVENHLVEQAVRNELAAHPELLELVLPALQADLEAMASYRYHPAAELDIPVTAFLGSSDEQVGRAHVEGWRRETTGDVRISELHDADHLFSGEAWERLARATAAELQQRLHRIPRPATGSGP